MLLSFTALAQNLSPEEQKRLIEENASLKAQAASQELDPAQSEAIMQKLQKGQKHQQESNEYLEELDKEN